MGNIQIKNVPEEVHEELRRRARQRRTTIRDYVLHLIEKDQALPTMTDWFATLRTREPIKSELSSAELVRLGREQREQQLMEALDRSRR